MMMRIRPVRALLALLALLSLAQFGAACGGSGGFPGLGGRDRVSVEEQAAYDAAMAELPADPAAAEARLNDYLQTYPRSALSDDAAEQLARLALIQGRRDDAFSWLEMVVVQYPDGDRADSARVRLARWEIGRSDPVRARDLLAGVRPDRLDRDDRRAYYRLQVQLSDDPVEQVVELAGLRRTVAEELAEQPAVVPESALSVRLRETLVAIDTEIDGLLSAMNGEQLAGAAVVLRSTPPAARIRLLLARQALDAGEVDRAKKLIGQAKGYELTPRDQEQLASLELRLGLGGQLSGRTVLPTFREASARAALPLDGVSAKIGVVLPLSGQYAPFGQEALRGIMLAAGIFDPDPTAATGESPGALPAVSAPGDGLMPAAETGSGEGHREIRLPSGVQLVVRDTGGSPVRAATAVRDIARDDSVVAIVGPIFSDECEAAAREADALRIPLLALSNRVELSNDRDYVFRLRLTPEDEVGFLVDYAIDQLGARRFAVLYPANRYGRGMRLRYWDAVVERGGIMVAAAAYDPEATDYSDAIRSMVGFDLMTNAEREALDAREDAMKRARRLPREEAGELRRELYSKLGPEGEPLPPVVDFDALFIPDASDRLQLLVPQLAYHEIQDVQLLGSSDWADPSLLHVGRQHVSGAVIATPFHHDSPFPSVHAFVTGYQASFGAEPDSFSSHAFDATNLVLLQIAQSRDTRDAIRDGLLRVRDYPGVSGVTSIEADGNARKRPFLLQVRKGRFVSLD